MFQFRAQIAPGLGSVRAFGVSVGREAPFPYPAYRADLPACWLSADLAFLEGVVGLSFFGLPCKSPGNGQGEVSAHFLNPVEHFRPGILPEEERAHGASSNDDSPELRVGVVLLL